MAQTQNWGYALMISSNVRCQKLIYDKKLYRTQCPVSYSVWFLKSAFDASYRHTALLIQRCTVKSPRVPNHFVWRKESYMCVVFDSMHDTECFVKLHQPRNKDTGFTESSCIRLGTVRKIFSCEQTLFIIHIYLQIFACARCIIVL